MHTNRLDFLYREKNLNKDLVYKIKATKVVSNILVLMMMTWLIQKVIRP